MNIDRDLLRTRLRDFNFGAIQQVASLVHSGVVALAAVVLMEILTAQEHAVLRLVLWGNSLAVVLIAFCGMYFNSMLAAPRGLGLVLLTLLIGLLEFLHFVVLSEGFAAKDGWRWWYAVQFLLSLVTVVTLHVTLVRWRSDFVAPDAQEFDPIMKGWTKTDRDGQAIVTILTAAAAVFAFVIDDDAYWALVILYAYSAVLFALAVAAFATISGRFDQLRRFVRTNG
jgi:hypothetical protein